MNSWAIALVCAAVVMFGLFETHSAKADSNLRPDWPQWRGPNRDASADTTNWPDSLDDGHLQSHWRVELAPGYPGPIIGSDRVFVAETRDGQVEITRALERSTGAELWRAAWPGSFEIPSFARRNGDWIRATPAYDGESLFVLGMRDVLACLDAADGSERWRVDFNKRFGTPLPGFGAASSPLVIGEHVYVQAGGGFAKLDKRDGSTIWRTLVDEVRSTGGAFASPVHAEFGGTSQLVVQTRSRLAGVLPESGELLWSQEIPAFRGMNILTPTVTESGVFTSAYGGKSILIGLENSNTRTTPNARWTQNSQGYMSSPVVIDDHVYLHMRNRRLTCIDLRTGSNRWTTKPFGEYWSMVTSGGKILALDQRGIVYLVRANPDRFELLDSRRVSDEETWGHLAVSGDQIFVRELRAIAAYRWR